MRAVSDFLDRVASRAIGGEGMLSPRLPSLFEPARDAVMPVMAEAREAGPSAVAATVGAREPARDPVGALPLRQVLGESAPVSRAAPVVEGLPALAVHPVRALATRAETDGGPPARPQAASLPGPDARPMARQDGVRHEHVHRFDALPRQDADRGALLPPRNPVFPVPPVAMGYTDRGASRQLGQQGREPGQADHEPVVHVSIGRLEVRAGPAATSASRRQESPRRNAFDDYLRERGKASP
jgi:hypothetical protein